MSAQKLASWGGYPPYEQTPHVNFWRGDLSRNLTELARLHTSTLPFGNGQSYGDSCLASSDHVLHTRNLNRFISVNWKTGVIVAEAGVAFEEILALSIPQGWFLPVTPGTKNVTLGGAIANDVHGKNHHVRGTFGRHVRQFELVRSDRPSLICSLEENAELFAATIGGLGLTGVIAWAEIQLIPIRSSMMDTTTVRFSSLGEFFKLCSEFDNAHEYTVAWIDCLAQGKTAGRGVFMAANHTAAGPLEVDQRRKKTVLLTPPMSLVNRYSLRLFNEAYYRSHSAMRQKNVISYEPFFYPLDRILKWNRLYGPKGFQQYQCVIPEKNAETAMRDLLNTIAQKGGGSFLAVLKKCGNISSPGLLSFPMAGTSLALDFPQNSSLNSDLFPRLDALVRKAGGRLYPAKDAHMSGENFRHFYPHWSKVESWRDPALCSRFWKRVTA